MGKQQLVALAQSLQGSVAARPGQGQRHMERLSTHAADRRDLRA